ncbi:MAG: hypothetical protein ACE5GX_14965 [Thermoanaerobaculia bacterium]
MRDPDKRVLALLAGSVVWSLGLATQAIRAQSICASRAERSIVNVGSRSFLQSGESLVELVTVTAGCYSCHDGTVADSVSVQTKELEGRAIRRSLFSRRTHSGTAATSHPVDVPYPLHDAEYVPRNALDARLELQNDLISCQTCHGGESGEYQLSVPVSRSELCLSCHLK